MPQANDTDYSRHQEEEETTLKQSRTMCCQRHHLNIRTKSGANNITFPMLNSNKEMLDLVIEILS